MAEISSEKLQKAKNIFKTMVQALKKADWKFDEHEDDLVIVSGYTGDDFPIRYIMCVDPKRDCVTFRSDNIVTFPENLRIEGALATCVANCGMIFGHFDYDIDDGKLVYTMSDSYADCDVGDAFFMRMMGMAVSTVDHYNDKFMMLAKGIIDIKKFIDSDK